jgi:hypothetical protein
VNKGASAQAITEFEVSGTIDQYHLNNYYFTTDGGTVQVQDLVGSTDPQYDYLIYNIDTQQSYESGANLPTGNYFITVLGTSDTPVNFDYKLSGISFSNTSTVLPNMAVSSPTTHEVRLPKGQMSTTFMIQNDDPNTSQVYYYGVDGSVQTVPRTVDGNPDPFSSGYLKVGVSPVQFQIVGTNNNEVWDFYYFSTPYKRFGGADRYEVSANIYREIKSLVNPDTIVLASGQVFPDALTGGPLAYNSGGAPLLLTTTDSLPSSISSVIQETHPTSAIIMGGTGSVSTNVETQLRNLGVQNITRVLGADRYEVAANAASMWV